MELDFIGMEIFVWEDKIPFQLLFLTLCLILKTIKMALYLVLDKMINNFLLMKLSQRAQLLLSLFTFAQARDFMILSIIDATALKGLIGI